MPRTFTLIEAPFHLGVPDLAVGAGPRRILEAGADAVLATRGLPAQVVHTRFLGGAGTDLDAIVDVNRQIRHAVLQAVEQDTIPVVLAGNCNSSLGTLAGLDPDRLGIVWLDAHGDFHTPESSLSGSLEGMSLAVAVGHCHAGLRERIGITRCVDERNVLLLGVSDLDEPAETARLALSPVTVRPHDRLEDVPELLLDLRSRADAAYLHIDLDFLAPGRLTAEQGLALLSTVLGVLPLAAANLTNYDPALDSSGATLETALRLLAVLASGPQPR